MFGCLCCEIMTSKWSSTDKTALLEALRTYGPSNIEAVAQQIPLKSLMDVTLMIKRYERAAGHVEDTAIDSPIDKWIKLMRYFTDYNDLVPISKALKYIALFEDRVEGDVKIGDCYQILSDLSQGIAPMSPDHATTTFLFDVLVQVAKESKKDKNGEFMNYLNNLSLDSLKFKTSTYNKSRKPEDASINPFKVPKELYEDD